MDIRPGSWPVGRPPQPPRAAETSGPVVFSWAALPQDTRWVQGRPWMVSAALPGRAGVPAAPNGLMTSPAPGPALPARPIVGRTGVHRRARWTNSSDSSTELPSSGKSAWTGLQTDLPEEATKRDGSKYVVLPGPGQAFPLLSDGTPLQYSGLENPTRGGAWESTVHGGHQESDTTGQLLSRFHLACGRKSDPRLSLSSASAQGGQGSPPCHGWKGSACKGALLQRSPGGDTHLDPPVSPLDTGRESQLLHFICLRTLGELEVSGRLPETIRQGAHLTDPTVSGVLRPQASATIKPQGPSISAQAPFPSMPTLAQS